MIILTSANHRFAAWVALHRERALQFGYRHQVYDLGGLGCGKPFRIDDPSFHEHGYYRSRAGVWRSRSLHKPAIVLDCLREHGEFTAYLDADAILRGPIDEVATDDYDIGVTVRRPDARERAKPAHWPMMGWINAGVIFFRPGARTLRFLEHWDELTQKIGNDQAALNRAVNPDGDRLLAGMLCRAAGARVRSFPVDRYNFWFFPEQPGSDTRILHFKGSHRKVRLLRPHVPDPEALAGVVKQGGL